MPSAKLTHRVTNNARPYQTTATDNPPRPQPSIPRPIATCKSNSDLTKLRIFPSGASTFLRSGTVFQGMQHCGRSTFQVKVKFHYVDLHSSFLCGFLCIQGLSLDNPSLTTYFEAELIGPHYSFQTRRPEWGATERSDLDHWTRFPALKQIKQGKTIKNGWDKAYKKPLDKEYVFMRWKEMYLHSAQPNDPVSFDDTFMTNNPANGEFDRPETNLQLDGFSYAGFYYISFHQVTGNISGMYFAESSEQFQQLDLSPVNPHRVTFPTFEFR